MELKQMHYFLTAAQEQSFAKAAEKEFTSRQNMAHAVRSLETELGAQLFVRVGNTMQLTQAGERAVEYVQQIVDAESEMRAAFSEEAPDIPLSIMFTVPYLSFVDDSVVRAIDPTGNWASSISESDAKGCFSSVENKRCDIGIIMAMNRQFPDCDQLVLSRFKPSLIVSENSDLANEKDPYVQQLAGHHLLLLGDFEFQYEPLAREFEHSGIPAPATSVITSIGAMKRIVRDMDAVGISLEPVRFRRSPGIRAVTLSDRRFTWCISAIWRRDNPRAGSCSKWARRMRATIDSVHRANNRNDTLA